MRGRRGNLERDVPVDRTGFDGLAGRIPRCRRHFAAHPGLRQRPAVDQQRVQRGADAANVVFGGGVGHGRGEGQHHVAFDADPHPAGMVDRQRDARMVGGVGCSREGLHRAGSADRGW